MDLDHATGPPLVKDQYFCGCDTRSEACVLDTWAFWEKLPPDGGRVSSFGASEFHLC